MESLANFDLEMYPDILTMLDGIQVGDEVRLSASFTVKEMSDKKFSASFNDNDSDITISKIGGDDDEASEDSSEEEGETEEGSG
jgi:hypothetical protein